MNYKTWTTQDYLFLKKNYDYMEINEIASFLGRTEWSIRMYAYRKGFRKHWTDTEVAFLKENYRKLSIDELVFELDRPKHAITQKIYRLKKGGVKNEKDKNRD